MALRPHEAPKPNVFVPHDQLLGKRLRYSAEDNKLFVKTNATEERRLVHEFHHKIMWIGTEFSFGDYSFFSVSIEGSRNMHNTCIMRMHSRRDIEASKEDKTATLVSQSWALFQGVCLEVHIEEGAIMMLPPIGSPRREQCMNYTELLRQLLMNPEQKIVSRVSNPSAEELARIERHRSKRRNARLSSVAL